jgi:rRNA maturation protein Rpf1
MMQDLHATIPNSLRINRGKLGAKGLADVANILKANYVLIIESWGGGVGSLKFYSTEEGKLTPIQPTLYVSGYRLRRDYERGAKSRRRPSKLAILQPQKAELRKLAEALSRVFNADLISEVERLLNIQVFLQVLEAPRAVARLTFFSANDKVEIGPSMTLKCISWDGK